MNRLTRYLNQPYPATSKRWQTVVISSLIVFFVLGIFQPFGIGSMIKDNFVILLGFVLVTFIGVSVVVYILPLLFKRFYSGNWTVGKNLLNTFLIILFISMGNTLYYLLIFKHAQLSWEDALYSFIFYIIVTLLVSVVPYVIISFLQHNNLLSQHLQEAQELNKKLSERVPPQQTAHDSTPITLSGNTKDSIELHPEQLIYLEAYGNYVKVNYTEDNIVKQKLLRTTIKQMEDELAPVSSIVRCHRAFLVNVKYISSVKGNSQGYRLIFDYPTEEIPVSRAYAKEIRDRLG